MDSLPRIDGLIEPEYATGGPVSEKVLSTIGEVTTEYGDRYGMFADPEPVKPTKPEYPKRFSDLENDLQNQKLMEIEIAKRKRIEEIQQLGRPRHTTKKDFKPTGEVHLPTKKPEVKIWIDEAKDMVDKDMADKIEKVLRDALMGKKP